MSTHTHPNTAYNQDSNPNYSSYWH